MHFSLTKQPESSIFTGVFSGYQDVFIELFSDLSETSVIAPLIAYRY
ncbi:hypothetical protein CSB69_1982 [Morganella morganii]|nr:hypothetical protein CSB69_1982 [Morganella morganii]EMP51591.1 hypothetical protein C790_00986 [Morganella morganii SC01]